MSAPMSKLRTGRRNLLAVTPALLLLTVSSLCFIPLSHQAPVDKTLSDAGCSLKGSEDVRKRLSDLSELYFLFSQTKLENYQKSNAYLVNQKALDVVTEHLVRFKAGSTESAVTAAEVDFNDDNEEVKVKLECEGKDTMVEISVAARRMRGNEKNEMEKFFPKNVRTSEEIFGNDEFWKKLLRFSGIFGLETELDYGNLIVGNKHPFAEIFEVTYSASGTIRIEPYLNGGYTEYTVNRIVTAAVSRVEPCVEVLNVPVILSHTIEWRDSTVLEDRQNMQDTFWGLLIRFYKDALNTAWEENSKLMGKTNSALPLAISAKKIFDYKVDGLSVKTVLTKVYEVKGECPKEDVIRVYATSTLAVPDCPTPIKLYHNRDAHFNDP
eukprot:GHVS01059668.1.p1 GENE.GHVS01059668.1~~GHVS01059668.1.p1  ORF type:complete len:381 (-),score=25.52 GHVS01059668.1:89-1231(-)